MSKVKQATLDVIAQISGQPAEGLTESMDLVGELGIDSPKALQLLIEIEERLGIEISDEDAESLNTVGDVLSFVATAKAG